MADKVEIVGTVTRMEQRERVLREKHSGIVREECCSGCHDGVCETCKVDRAVRRIIWGDTNEG